MPKPKRAKKRDRGSECFFCHAIRSRTRLIEIFEDKYSCVDHNGAQELHDELMAVRQGR